jgi:lambda repressor-like predicted transcriptional regulator
MKNPKNTPEHLRATWSDRYVTSDRGCHEWSGGRSPQGYGSVAFEGQMRGAHRLAYELFVGPIPDGMVVMHECDNPCCVNPAHLRVGTYADNTRDMLEKGRDSGTSPQLHGPDWPIFLKRLNQLGLSQERLAVKFGVSRGVIRAALKRAPRGERANTRRACHGNQALPGPDWPIFLRKLNQLGLSQRRLAEKFGVSSDVIRATMNR